MIQDGSGNEFVSSSPLVQGSEQQNPNFLQSHSSQRSAAAEKSFMEAVDRTFSDLYRNSSEEIFLKTLMESPIRVPAPTMEMLGFKNLSQTFRADSEELFNSWLMHGEINGSIANRTRQASRRLSAEFAGLCNQQRSGTSQSIIGNSNLVQENIVKVEDDSNSNQQLLRNIDEKGVQDSNFFLAKAWFQSAQPMTRSRSSELRRRYAAMQNSQMSGGGPIPNAPEGAMSAKQDFATAGVFSDISVGEMSSQMGAFRSPSNSSSSPFSTRAMTSQDAISSVVSMLKGTLERKKLGTQLDNDSVAPSPFGFYASQEALFNIKSDQMGAVQMPSSLEAFRGAAMLQVKDLANLHKIEECAEANIEGFIPPTNLVVTTASQERSQSESSAAAPVLSTGLEICDGATSSRQTISFSGSSLKNIGNGKIDHGYKAHELTERIFENNVKDERKRGGLVRMGSITSGGSVYKGDPTKKRRVERSRKMAEAKERNMAPVIPSDMQAILKRCDNLEKEARSLRLNLSFMNRKDSEQTKQIEELQKQNEDLASEKERLLEEIERILSEESKM